MATISGFKYIRLISIYFVLLLCLTGYFIYYYIKLRLYTKEIISYE